MDFRDSNQDSSGVKYVSKKVMINGQFVTLYSANGQTWVSSPEDIPALMERLQNVGVSLNTAERVAEGEGSKAAEPEQKEKKEPPAAAERVLATKYRVKGPKPRPILRQDGVVIKGTPIDPVSASNAVMSFSSDVKESEQKTAGKSAKSSKGATDKPKKLIAPVVTKKQTKAAVPSKMTAKAISAKVNSAKNGGVTATVPAGKAQKVAGVSIASAKGGSKKPAQKAIAAKPVRTAPAKSVAKTATKPIAKKTAAKASKQPGKTAAQKVKSPKKSGKKAR